MEGARNLTPREVWAMRLDEAIALCAGRMMLLKQGRNPAAKPAADEKMVWRDVGGGKKQASFTGVDSLYDLLRGGMPG